MSFTRFNKVYFVFSGLLVGASIVALIIFGLNLGIDFTGGSILEAEYQGDRPSQEVLTEALGSFELGSLYIQPSGENSVIIRMPHISEETHQQILHTLESLQVDEGGGFEEKRFEAIGPVIGRELKQKTLIVVVVALLSILVYIALAFRRIQRPVRSWYYGIASLIALFHDALIPLGVFAVLGAVFGVQLSIPIVTALLIVVGYSINNTVVVFDRIREHLFLHTGADFATLIDASLQETVARQVNTALTTLVVVVAIFLFGGATLQYFALALIIGILAGTYSSFFIAPSLLVAWYQRKS